MKNNFIIILSLILISTNAGFCANSHIRDMDKTKKYTVQKAYYNPYYNYYYPYSNSYYYQKMTPYQVKKLQQIRKLNRLKRNYRYISWFNNKNNGSLTGYSTPINSDIYQQMGITPYNIAPNQSPKSINCNTDLFSNPQGNEFYSKNGRFYRDLSGTNGKTGVTIIYD